MGRRLATLHNPALMDMAFGGDLDADARRMRTDLDAIRVRFPDHA